MTRLALHYHEEVQLHDGVMYIDPSFGKWVDSMAGLFTRIVLVLHAREVSSPGAYALSANNLELLSLGPKPEGQFWWRLLHAQRYRRIVRAALDRFDMIGLRVPTPLAIYLFPVVRHKRVFHLLVGNLILATRCADITPWKKWILLAYWSFDHWLLSRQCNRSIAMANGIYYRVEFPRIRDLRIVFTSTITEADLQPRQDFRLHEPCSILYVGRVVSDKGLDTLIEAVATLRADNLDCRLNLVGGVVSPAYRRELDTLLDHLGVGDAVVFHGYVPHGPRMNALLDASDVFVSPSRWDWQPRTTWEAMARGVPVVASTGIKSFALTFQDRHDMMFFEPGNTDQLSAVLRELLGDQGLRAELGRRGGTIAAARTVNRSARLIADVANGDSEGLDSALRGRS